MKLENPQYHRWQLTNEIQIDLRNIEREIKENEMLKKEVIAAKKCFHVAGTYEKAIYDVESNIIDLKMILKADKKVLAATEEQMFQGIGKIIN